MFAKKRFLLIVGVLLFLTVGTAYALPPRVSWIPSELKPDSIAPGESASYAFTLKHTGILPILLANQLKVVAEGDIVPFVTLTQPTFPPVFKKGNQVNVAITVSVPSTTPLSVKTGGLVLKRFVKIKVGKVIKEVVTDVWRANALPVELTFSAIPLPPDPGEEGKEGVLGVDTNGNSVRDDIERWAAFSFSDSAKKRRAVTQGAEAEYIFLREYLADPDNKEKARENEMVRNSAGACRWYVFGADSILPGGDEAAQAVMKNTKDIIALVTNTPERLRTYTVAERHLGGMTIPGIPVEQKKSHCSFNPDALPN